MFNKAKTKTLKVLLIDENRSHAHMFKEVLARSKSHEIVMEHASRLLDGIFRIKKHRFDAIFINPELSESYGLCAVREVCRNANGTPVLVLTNIEDEKMALESVKEGAQDYLIIGKLSDESVIRSVIYAMARQTHRVSKSSSIKLLEDLLEDCDV